jgi:predicted DNA binding CopG/RHH family protein
MIGTTENYKVNQHAMKQRIEGKTFREIGEELGVGVERARQRVYWGFRYSGKYERDKNAKTMGDLFISERLKNIIKGIPADHMTFDEFLENFSQQKLMDTENFGKMCVKELAETLRNKNVSEEKISAWLNVKIKKVKKKPMARLWQRGPEEKHDTCQRYVIAEGRLFMGSLCNEPLLPRQKKYCTKHKGNQS